MREASEKIIKKLRHQVITFTLGLGGIAQGQRHWQQAEQNYQQALKIFIDFNDLHSQAHSLYQLGIVAVIQGQLEQAEYYNQQVSQICIDFNDLYSQAGTFQNLGMVAQGQGLLQKAEQYHQQALQIYIDLNESAMIRSVLCINWAGLPYGNASGKKHGNSFSKYIFYLPHQLLCGW